MLQRERAFLRRLSTTPVHPLWLLTAQVVVNLALAFLAIVLIVGGDVLFFGVHAPSQVPGIVLCALLATAALFAIGLLISAVAPTARTAGVMGTIVLYPMLYFAGLSRMQGWTT